LSSNYYNNINILALNNPNLLMDNTG
jgi:hypothetical protein